MMMVDLSFCSLHEKLRRLTVVVLVVASQPSQSADPVKLLWSNKKGLVTPSLLLSRLAQQRTGQAMSQVNYDSGYGELKWSIDDF